MPYSDAAFAQSVLKLKPSDICFSVPKIFFAYGFGNSITFPFSAGATSLLLPGQPRTTTMDLSDRLVEHDHWHTARLLEQAATLSDEALDRHVRPGLVVHAFEGPEPDVRTMLDRVVFTKEVWTAAIAGRDFPADRDRSIAGQQARLAAVQPQFTALVRRIRDRNEWDDVFVDALCTPPVSFTFGSVIAHILTVSVIRRQTVIDVLRELGVRDVETRDPIEWERAMAARS